MAELPSVFSRVRSESARGCWPRCSRTVRKPSVMAASATSLAVTPNLWHTASTASRGTRTAWYRRLVVTGPAGDVTAGQLTARAAAVQTAPAMLTDIRHSVSAQLRASPYGGICLISTLLAKALPSASSQSLASRWAADMAPAMQWWIFIKIAQRLPLRPSMIQHSHSGRSGSRGRSSASAMARNSSASSPGRGSATRRTCWVRSNPG